MSLNFFISVVLYILILLGFFSDMHDEFDYIADHVGKNWRLLARKLGVSDAQIDNIQEAHSRDLREQAYSALKAWVAKNPGRANKDVLIQTLRACKLNLIADDLMMKIVQNK